MACNNLALADMQTIAPPSPWSTTSESMACENATTRMLKSNLKNTLFTSHCIEKQHQTSPSDSKSKPSSPQLAIQTNLNIFSSYPALCMINGEICKVSLIYTLTRGINSRYCRDMKFSKHCSSEWIDPTVDLKTMDIPWLLIPRRKLWPKSEWKSKPDLKTRAIDQENIKL